MGRDKTFLSFQGKPLIEHAIEIVREAGAAEVLISGRPEQNFSAYGCPVLLDLKPDCGPLGGIERGLHAATHPMVFVLAVDLPHMTGNCLRWLISSAMGRDAFHRAADFQDGNGGAVERDPVRARTGIVPVRDGQLEPLVACYPKLAHDVVAAMLREQQLAARELAERCVARGLVAAVEVPGQLEACFANWNTPEDVVAVHGMPKETSTPEAGRDSVQSS